MCDTANNINEMTIPSDGLLLLTSRQNCGSRCRQHRSFRDWHCGHCGWRVPVCVGGRQDGGHSFCQHRRQHHFCVQIWQPGRLPTTLDPRFATRRLYRYWLSDCRDCAQRHPHHCAWGFDGCVLGPLPSCWCYHRPTYERRWLCYTPGHLLLTAQIWFQIHRLSQPIGFVIACVGFIIGWVMADGAHFTTGSGGNAPHAVIALVVMLFGAIQIPFGIARPHKVSRSDRSPSQASPSARSAAFGSSRTGSSASWLFYSVLSTASSVLRLLRQWAVFGQLGSLSSWAFLLHTLWAVSCVGGTSKTGPRSSNPSVNTPRLRHKQHGTLGSWEPKAQLLSANFG